MAVGVVKNASKHSRTHTHPKLSRSAQAEPLVASETIPGNPHGGPFAVFAVFKSTETTGHQEHVMLVPLEEHVMTYIPFGFRLRTEHRPAGFPVFRSSRVVSGYNGVIMATS